MTNKIDDTLSILIGLIAYAAIISMTIAVVPAIILIAIAKIECSSWKEALKTVYIDMPVSFFTNKV